METAILASVVPVAYLLGLLTTVRILIWTMARITWRDQENGCWASCKTYCERRKPHQGWDSLAHAFAVSTHPQDWACAWFAAIFWPAILPVYLCWHPVKWFLTHPPSEKLSLDEKVKRAEEELEAAREAQAAAQGISALVTMLTRLKGMSDVVRS